MEKKILFIVPYPTDKAPSQRLKFEQYYPYFEQEGYKFTISPFISKQFWEVIYKPGKIPAKFFYTCLGYLRRIKDLFRIRKYDIVYIHLWVTPFGPPFFEYLFTKLAKAVVYDIDDLVYLTNKTKANRLAALIKGRKKPIFLIKKADQVISCTPVLDDFVKKYNNNSTDISSTVDTNVYVPTNTYSNAHKLTLGWSGSQSTARYFYLLKDILLKLKEKFDFNILVMGDATMHIPGLDIEAVDWTKEEEIKNLQKIDIGLYPLPLDEEWVYGKSGLKAIQYMALGIPTVATAIGANYRVINHQESGFLVTTKEDWLNALMQLMNDPELRQKIGLKAREKVVKNFSVEANYDSYLRVLNNAAK